MVFERPHHQRIAHVLEALNADLLRQLGVLFGGGTCIALRCGEYRESVDIDFLVSDLAGYRELRELLTGVGGLHPIVRAGATPLVAVREVRAASPRSPLWTWPHPNCWPTPTGRPMTGCSTAM